MMAGVLALSMALFPSSARAQDSVQELRREINELKFKVEMLEKERKVDRARIRQLEDDLDRLRSRATTSRRSSYYDEPTVAERGTIVLRNQLDVTGTVTINGVAYSVPAGGTKTINLPVGAIRYVVTADGFGVSSMKRSTLAASDPVTITLYP